MADAGGLDFDDEEDGGDWAAEEDLVDPTVRENFADTALWVGSLTTGVDGKAQVSLDMPENLTSWKVRVWSLAHRFPRSVSREKSHPRCWMLEK